ncbi:hypothetical protein [Nonomuraea sp. NPDC049129]|uniref:hypothetical protein n=1 Tax=unclassified Nonomuraea TaxID=2593643 RepID=UPI0033DCC5C7
MALPDDPAASELMSRFPKWTIRRSDVGRYWATREESRLSPGCSVTVDADDLHGLEAKLAYQERLRAQLARRAEIPFTTGDPT